MRFTLPKPPVTPREPVTDILHGVPITDPYRWLEDQDSTRTREWLEQQSLYARAYLDAIPGRDRIRSRIRDFLAIETYDSLQKMGSRYFFRKRLPGQEQPCIYMRDGEQGEDQLLVDPRSRGGDPYTAVIPICASWDGQLLLYQVKHGGERTGAFELLAVESRQRLPDVLPSGCLRGLAFAPDAKRFYYVLEAVDTQRPFYRAAYCHVLGTPFSQDQEIFYAGEDATIRLRLMSDGQQLGFAVYKFGDMTSTDFYLKGFESPLQPIFIGLEYAFGPVLCNGRVFAITDKCAPNFRIVELQLRPPAEPLWIDIVPESENRIDRWVVTRNRVLVSHVHQLAMRVSIFDFSGRKAGQMSISPGQTTRLIPTSSGTDEAFVETESFTDPVALTRFSPESQESNIWARKSMGLDPTIYTHLRETYRSKDGTEVPILLMGRRDVLAAPHQPTIMTAYGGFGASMTPQFSVFVAFLVEKGCLFALPNIRGGSEFGVAWHKAAQRRNRQTSYDDFLCAAEWLIATGRTSPKRLAIFGGSNSGLLVGAALTQRPDLFCSVVCMVPLLDMLRYHHFDNARVWKDEFGTADNVEDFAALAQYSPYHRVREGIAYPSVMLISGDADHKCNSLHARKMTARLQAANASDRPIFLDYSKFRGHSPVLPLNHRIDALTDRMSFLCDQLQLTV